MTNEETALADKILKDATMAFEPGMRRLHIEDYSALVRAARDRHDATPSARPCSHTATEIMDAAE